MIGSQLDRDAWGNRAHLAPLASCLAQSERSVGTPRAHRHTHAFFPRKGPPTPEPSTAQHLWLSG